MAIVQISQIQVRRGLNQDLPQLASGEMAWSLDTRQLYIGNGTLAEGAPSLGITEVLTQYSDISASFQYTFSGSDSGFTSTTGVNSSYPVVRSLQQVLDEHISVKDFGAVGDGVTDDTNAINRAIQQTYYNLLNGATVQDLLYKNTQRAIRFPAGTYLISSTILVPPNCTLIGEGKNNTRIYSPLVSAISTCDSFFQTGTNMGTGLTINTGVTQYPIFPSFITVEDMEFQTLQSVPAVYIQAANHVIFNRCQFSGGTYGATIDAVTISAQTTPSSEIKFLDSTFTGYTGNPINITPNSTGIVVRNDHIDTTQVILAVGTNNITTLANGAGRIDYQIQDNDNSYRFGTVKYNVDVGVAVFDDEFTEPATSLGANVHIYPNAAMYCSVPVQSTLKYNIKQFT